MDELLVIDPREGLFLSRIALMHYAEMGDVEFVEHLLLTAEKLGKGKAWKLITLEDIYGKCAWRVSGSYEIRDLMRRYMPVEETNNDEMSQFIDKSVKLLKDTLL